MKQFITIPACIVFTAVSIRAQCSGPPPYTPPDAVINGAPEGVRPPETPRDRDRPTSTGDRNVPTPRDRGPARTPSKRTPRGTVLTFTRGPSSKRRLEIDWQYPKVEYKKAGTSAVTTISGTDPRPLLILRECRRCKGTNDALLDKKLDNETTKLMTRWFRCVRFTNEVWNPAHPYHSLFKGPTSPHLILRSRDGTVTIPFDGLQSNRVLWTAMKKVVSMSYRKDPSQAIRSWRKLLHDLDTLDDKRNRLVRMIDQIELMGNGNPRQLTKLRADLRKLGKIRNQLRAREAKILDLGLIAKHDQKALARRMRFPKK